MMDKKHEEIVTKFGNELADSCKKANISSKSRRELADCVDAMINDIIEDYPEIDDTFVNLPDWDVRVDVMFVDGTEVTVSLGIQTHYTITDDIIIVY